MIAFKPARTAQYSAYRDPWYASSGSVHAIDAVASNSSVQNTVAAIADEDVHIFFSKIEDMLEKVRNVAALDEIPEVFNLRPLTSHRVKARIVREGRPHLVFVDDHDAPQE